MLEKLQLEGITPALGHTKRMAGSGGPFQALQVSAMHLPVLSQLRRLGFGIRVSPNHSVEWVHKDSLSELLG